MINIYCCYIVCLRLDHVAVAYDYIFVFQNDTRLSSGYDFLAFDEAGQTFDEVVQLAERFGVDGPLGEINLDDLADGMETCA